MTKLLHDLNEKHKLYQLSDGFLFGTDAVLLSGIIRPGKNDVGVELGTGTGIIPILLSIHKEFKKIYAVEIQPEYASLARENITMNGFSHKVEVIEGDLKKANQIVPTPCDFVFSNPPYMKKDSGAKNENEKKKIARHEVACDIRDVCRAAASLLQDKGDFYCVYRIGRMTELFSAMREFDLEPKNLILTAPKENSAPNLILVRGVKGAKPFLKTRPLFIIQDKNGNKTEECLSLYETGFLSYEEEM